MSKPTHGRGTAAEQGAAIREKFEAERKEREAAQEKRRSARQSQVGSQRGKAGGESERSSKRSSTTQTKPKRDSTRSSHDVVAASKRETDQGQAQVEEKEKAKKQAPVADQNGTTSPPQSEVLMASATDARASETEKTATAKSESKEPEDGATTKAAAATATGAAAGAGVGAAAVHSDQTQQMLDRKGRMYPVTGIDNLALLMENDTYQTTCFSIYLFKTELDSETLTSFFEHLADSYPKYRYKVELSPSEAAKKEKAHKKGEAEKKPTEADQQGRRTSDGQGMIMSYHAALGAMDSGKSIEEIQRGVDRKTGSGEQKKPGQRNIKPTLWGTTKHFWHTGRGLYFSPRKAFDYPKSSSSPTKNGRVKDRLYCHSDGIPMADIKAIREAYSTEKTKLSLNDVACAVLSRALRIAAERTASGPVKDKRVAIFVPISVRPQGNWELANFTTGAIAWFRFHDPATTSFETQLQQVNREMNRIKRSYWPRWWYQSFGLVSRNRAWFVPNYPVGRSFFETTYREYHVATNVPGPAKEVSFGQHQAYSYHVLPPSSPGKSSLSIGMISYANDFSLAVSCDDAASLRDKRLPQEICTAFQDAAQELIAAAKKKTAGGSHSADQAEKEKEKEK
ncbi:hypothetical protein L7F22_064663 [Adiantum nelumboides]|nr:hypothetical protein [Adiantum nelumboides]